MVTVRNKTRKPVTVTLTTGEGFHLAPGETRSDFPDAELYSPFFAALVDKRQVMVVPPAPESTQQEVPS